MIQQSSDIKKFHQVIVDTINSLSTTDAEYVAASEALRYVIPMMHMITELTDAGFPVNTQQLQVHCKLFEDNSGALEMLSS